MWTGPKRSEPVHNVDGSFVEVAVAVFYAHQRDKRFTNQGRRATPTDTDEGI